MTKQALPNGGGSYERQKDGTVKPVQTPKPPKPARKRSSKKDQPNVD